ncbi:MAG TPA: 30S ribosomal protein S16 [Candidatus Binatia bacterium]|jgi:small subunit ribosomal protein S16|nr:30S ribosomal protein S16 [Candidatus Binatia bacterium]
MLVIRLTRVGKRKQPTYRVVVQDKTKDPWGKAKDIIGQYNPRTKPKTVIFKEDRVKFWIEKGAQPSPTVHNLLVDAKIISGEKLKANKGSGKGADQKKEEKAA